MKKVYIAAAILGTLIPWYFFAQFISLNGLDIPFFASSLFANGAAGGFSADVLISLFVFWIWSYGDARKRQIAKWWLVLPAGLTVGLSLSLPLYLLMRER